MIWLLYNHRCTSRVIIHQVKILNTHAARPTHQKPIFMPVSPFSKRNQMSSPLANKGHAFAPDSNISNLKFFSCYIFKKVYIFPIVYDKDWGMRKYFFSEYWLRGKTKEGYCFSWSHLAFYAWLQNNCKWQRALSLYRVTCCFIGQCILRLYF